MCYGGHIKIFSERMTDMKKWLATLLGLTMMFSIAGCSDDKKDDDRDEEKTEEKIAEANKAYADFLVEFMETDEYDRMYDPRFSTVYIDEDEIPELLIHEGTAHADGVKIYNYYDEKVIDVSGQYGYGGYGEVYYKEKENAIVSWYCGGGSCTLYEYAIVDGARSLTTKFDNMTYNPNTSEFGACEFMVDGEYVDEDDYIDALEDRGYTYDPDLGPTTEGCDLASYEEAFEFTEENIKAVFETEE